MKDLKYLKLFEEFADPKYSNYYPDFVEEETVLPSVKNQKTVVDIIVDSAQHNTLEAAVKAAGLVETLSGEGPFTVFAPTDEAFNALPAGTVEGLLEDIPALTNILTYHVVGSKAFSSDLTDGQMVMTLQKSGVQVTIDSNGVFINDSMVTLADIKADNGVVHVIDVVLQPTVAVKENRIIRRK